MDVNERVYCEIRYSPKKKLAMLLFVLLVSGWFLWVLISRLQTSKADPWNYHNFTLYGWLLISGILLIEAARSLAHGRGVIVRITTKGLLDRRISDVMIPWSDIVSIHPKKYGAAGHIVLTLTPEAEKSLPRTLTLRILYWPNRLFGMRGIPSNAGILDMDFGTYFRSVYAAWQASRL